MAKTTVVNPRKRRGKAKTKRRRRRNYGAAAKPAARRRRRNPAPAPARRRSSARRKNPSAFDLDAITDTVPAATGGIWAARWATKMAGPFEPDSAGVLEPGIKHAIAIAIAASFGGDLIGDLLGSAQKGEYARISALGWGGDLFARMRFFRDSQFVNEQFFLGEVDADYYDGDEDDDGGEVDGFAAQSPLGAVNTYTDATGQQWRFVPDRGWEPLSGVGAQFVSDDQGNVYQLDGAYPQNYARQMTAGVSGLSGFQATSALGATGQPSESNSFGYRPR